ncbi:hypothetical protein [Nocardia sp. NPDC004722]
MVYTSDRLGRNLPEALGVPAVTARNNTYGWTSSDGVVIGSGHCREFIRAVLSAVRFAGGTAATELLITVNMLRELNATGRRKKLSGISFRRCGCPSGG